MDEGIIVPARSKNASAWRRLLREWINLINQYSTPDNGEIDVPYWYGERALTGLLSAAAWKLKEGWALEEFTAERGTEGGSISGRGDLWCGMGDIVFTIEAKIHWPERDIDSAIQGTKGKLAAANKQLQSLAKDYRQGDPYSVCYVVPWPRRESIQPELHEVLALLNQVAERFASEKCIVAKYSFDASFPEDNGRVYPGVVLVAREEKWVTV